MNIALFSITAISVLSAIYLVLSITVKNSKIAKLENLLDELSELSFENKDLKEYIDILKSDLAADGVMLKNEVVIKEVKIDFSPEEREMLMIGIEEVLKNSSNAIVLQKNLTLLDKMKNIFTEAGNVEAENERSNN